MALRLSRPADAAKDDARTTERLDARARACLVAGDLRGYRELFARTESIDDPHRRYQARRTLVEQGLAAAAKVAAKDVPALFLAVAANTVDLLEAEPREPVLLNYAGVTLYELGALDAAEKLFKACRRLDDTVAHVEGNLEAIAQRRRTGNGAMPNLPAPVRAELKPLAARAKECAKKAKPVPGLTLSLCMIVKDEEEMLPRCLAAVKPAVDEMIIVDTGSSDRTVEIAESFGARVLHHEWNGSFSDARNVSLEAATGDWVIYLDADEVLVEEDAERLRAVTGRVWREAFALVETNYTGDIEDGTALTHTALRVFRNRPEYRFKGRLHEQMAYALPGYLTERIEYTQMRIEHYGYLGVVRDAKDKSRRNLELLLQQEEEGGQDTAFQAFNLGSEYLALGEFQTAVDYFEKAWRMLEGDPGRTVYPYVGTLANRYVTVLREMGRLEDADKLAVEALELFPGFTDLVFQQGWIARARGDDATARALYERCLEMGEAPSRYSSVVGCGTYLAQIALAQISTLAEAERLLTDCLEQHPGFLGAIHPAAAAMLANGREPEAVVEAIEASVEKLTATARFMLGTALYEAGAAEAAEEQFRGVLAQQPSSVPARVALAEAMLSQARYSEAAAVAAEVGDDEPSAGAARRSELFGLLVSGDIDGAAAVLARGREALPAGEAELFEAWLSAATGESLPATLPGQSAHMLAMSLEALLRVQEVDAFGMLVPLVDRVGLSPRDRRELLAAMYMRRGYLESAADEWISVIQELGPDAPALTGLALVAKAREMPDDALVFAREAREIDPGYAAATRLVSSLEMAA
jgi:glycosyltransferase involved in cell wall biosynthesis/predicted Zn-dependent protease